MQKRLPGQFLFSKTLSKPRLMRCSKLAGLKIGKDMTGATGSRPRRCSFDPRRMKIGSHPCSPILTFPLIRGRYSRRAITTTLVSPSLYVCLISKMNLLKKEGFEPILASEHRQRHKTQVSGGAQRSFNAIRRQVRLGAV